MSRKGKRHDQAKRLQFQVSMDTWLKFQRFLNMEEQLDEAMSELGEAYNTHIAYLVEEFRGCSPPTDEMDEIIGRLRHLIRVLNYGDDGERHRKKDRHNDYRIYQSANAASCVPVKKHKEGKKPQVATIIIEDISNGEL